MAADGPREGQTEGTGSDSPTTNTGKMALVVNRQNNRTVGWSVKHL